MKVLEVCDAYFPTVDGVVSVVKNYSTKIMKTEECVVAGPKPSKKINYVDNEPFKVIRCKSFPAPEKYRNAFPCLDKKYRDAVKNGNFDIIHTHSPFAMGRSALKIAKSQGIPLVATLHTQYHQDFQRVLGKRNPLVKCMIRYIMKVFNGADSVWTVSNASKRYLRMYGYKGDIRVIRNATDYVYPENAQELIDMVNEKHNLKGQQNVFVFVGRMAMYKNLKLLCDALKIVKDAGKDFKMLFVGGGFDYDELVKYTEDVSIDDKCIFTGAVMDRSILQAYYLRSDMLIFPSTFDMASIVQVEASAHKKPAVVVKDSCSAENIIDGENGFLCEENAQSLADKLISLCDKPEYVKQIGENAFKTLYRTWDMVGEEVVSAYKEVIKEYQEKHQAKEK